MTANYKFYLMLKAAYEYYWNNNSIISDNEYDQLTKDVYNVYDKITVPEKSLVDFENLKNCSSLFYIKKNSYPDFTKVL